MSEGHLTPLYKLAAERWGDAQSVYDAALVRHVYCTYINEHMRTRDAAVTAAQVLDQTAYLERYLWPHWRQDASHEHFMSIVRILLERSRDSIDVLPVTMLASGLDSLLFRVCLCVCEGEAALGVHDDKDATAAMRDRTACVRLLWFCAQAMEHAVLRKFVLRMTSAALWHDVSASRVELETRLSPSVRRSVRMCVRDRVSVCESADVREWMRTHTWPTSTAATPASGHEHVVSAATAGTKRPRDSASVSESVRGHTHTHTHAHTRAKDGRPAEGAEVVSAADGSNDDTRGASALHRFLEYTLIPSVLRQCLSLTATHAHTHTHEEDKAAVIALRFVTMCLALLVTLLSALPTRRFLCVLLDDLHIVEQLEESPWLTATQDAGEHRRASNLQRLFAQLLAMLDASMHASVNSATGEAVPEAEGRGQHLTNVQALQRVAFSKFPHIPEMRELALSASASVSKEAQLRAYLTPLSDAQLHQLCQHLRLLPLRPPAGSDADSREGLSKRPRQAGEPVASRAWCTKLLLRFCMARETQLSQINKLPLFPSEALLWDSNLVPSSMTSTDDVLALPILNLQFLTMHEYLLRCFHLYRLESAYEIRLDLVDAIRRCGPRKVMVADKPGAFPTPTTRFVGWARMAVPTRNFTVTNVAPPLVGHEEPGHVVAELSYDLAPYAPNLRAEWDALREREVVFLVCIRACVPLGMSADEFWAQQHGSSGASVDGGDKRAARRVSDEEDFDFPQRIGVKYVRGAEVVDILDDNGTSLFEAARDRGIQAANSSQGRATTRQLGSGTVRRLRLRLDAAQYHADALRSARKGAESPYTMFNLLVRRQPEENNFRAVLGTIRDLMNANSTGVSPLPSWLHDVFLGYGDPAAASANASASVTGARVHDIDFRDTFVSLQHIRDSFSDHDVEVIDEESNAVIAEPDVDPRVVPPFRIVAGAGDAAGRARLRVIPYRVPYQRALPTATQRGNTLPFTPTQIAAIRSCMNEGLTLIVGPPGTGKTDVAVQVVSNLYHNFPGQRILLVTHSNQALNDLFAKIAERDICDHHLLRLGQGEADLALATDQDFSKRGRVASALQRRNMLLQEVDRIAVSLGVPGDAGYTCETAEYFQLYHLVSRIEKFRVALGVPPPPSLSTPAPSTAHEPATAQSAVDRLDASAAATQAARLEYLRVVRDVLRTQPPGVVADTFPFSHYFASTMPYFTRSNAVDDLLLAEACFHQLDDVFSELASYRAFELLRSHRGRTDFLLMKHARIVAMTCTHAALNRARLVELGFTYDTVIMEEAAQVQEIETFIPLTLQPSNMPGKASRLKRIILIGDHHQLPPVVQNMTLARYSHLDQSLFTRFIRLGVPPIQLNRQGRARPVLSALYSWRYADLQDLPHVRDIAPFVHANAGFAHPVQVVNVEDFDGRGESTPQPYFYQNLGEAEFVVAVFQYMRLLGYPAERIAMLTTYNGQKRLLEDVVQRRCAPYPYFGRPARIETVDKYQGQQSDYVLLSLVRTRAIGHLRDVRRLIVALSRARLGLYIFARVRMFAGCAELAPAFSRLAARPHVLELHPEETWPTTRPHDAPLLDASVVRVMDAASMGRVVAAALTRAVAAQASAWAAGMSAAALTRTHTDADAHPDGTAVTAPEGGQELEAEEEGTAVAATERDDE